jgi:hypothetical protein
LLFMICGSLCAFIIADSHVILKYYLFVAMKESSKITKQNANFLILGVESVGE